MSQQKGRLLVVSFRDENSKFWHPVGCSERKVNHSVPRVSRFGLHMKSAFKCLKCSG